MPYIKPQLRDDIDPLLYKLIAHLSMQGITKEELAGCITYIIFKMIREFYEDGKWYEKMDAIKVCDSASDEFRRRFLHPYEDEKIKKNGDV